MDGRTAPVVGCSIGELYTSENSGALDPPDCYASSSAYRHDADHFSCPNCYQALFGLPVVVLVARDQNLRGCR